MAEDKASGAGAEAKTEASLPPDLLQLLNEHYESDAVASIVDGYAAQRVVSLRANTLKATATDVACSLDEAGIVWHTPAFYSDAFIVEGAREDAVRSLDLYEQGGIYLQSLSAMIPPLALAPHAGENILDMAAAPGGKTCQLAALAGNKALLTACEKNAVRAQKLRYNLSKQGVERCSVMECDARKLDEFFTFDKVLLDAPCSGSGTVSLTGGTYRGGFSRELLDRSVKTQKALLRRALEAVRPGGVVVYATCSILPEENEQIVESVLNPEVAGARNGRGGSSKRKGKHRGEPSGPLRARAKLIPLPNKLLRDIPLLPCDLEGAACIRPTELYEGFFVAMLERTK